MQQKTVIRLDISYNGTNFKGYQKQLNQRTVQEELERSLEILFQYPVEVNCAGRTDTGVHALHQVVSFSNLSSIRIPLEKLVLALNSLLPCDIRVLKASYEKKSFHARFSPKTRTYLYIINLSKTKSPFQIHSCWHYPFSFKLSKLKKTLKYFEGEHHFGSFCEKASTTNLVRTIFKIKVRKKKEFLFIYIKGNAFLRRMIRIIIGTSLVIASRKDTKPQDVQTIFDYQDRNKNPYPTAPPDGLYFYRVEY
jgi:tRNA pseudouridine38-40 synthase